jgi:hypothetical protein
MPLDPFAPPEMQREQQIELGDKPVVSGTVAPASNPAAAVPVTSTYRGGPGSGSATLHRDNAWSRARELMAESSRARFAAGIAVAFLIGLIPAQLYAGWRRGIAFEEIQGDLAEEYRRADTPELWSTLETAREDAEGLVAARQQRNAVGALLIWFLVGGGVAFVWFRLVDWEGAVPRLAQGPTPPAAARRRAIR